MKRRLIKNKSDRKRRKVFSVRKLHNLSAHRARDLDEEKRKQHNLSAHRARDLDVRNPQRRAAAHRARDAKRKSDRERDERKRECASDQEGLMFTVNSLIFATSIDVLLSNL